MYGLFCQLYQLFHFLGPAATIDVLDCLCTYRNSCHHLVCLGDGGTSDSLVAELDCVCEPFAASGFDMAPVRSVMLWGSV